MSADLFFLGKSSIMNAVLNLIDENMDALDDIILDCGCGIGTYVYGLTQLLYVGLDINISAIQVAVKKHRNISFVISDGTKMPFRNKIYDHVICSEVLEHVENDENLLEEIVKVLKYKGSLFLSVPLLNSNIFVDYQRSLIDDKVGHVRSGYYYPDLVELLNTFGFKLVNSKLNCGMITAILESITILLGGLFGYFPSNLESLFYDGTSVVFKIVFKLYRFIFPLLRAITVLDELLPRQYRSNIAVHSVNNVH